MSEDLMRIRFSGRSQAQLNRVRRISPELAKAIEAQGVAMLNRAAQLALQAAQSSVPIDSGALRKDIILDPPNSFTDTAVVFVAPNDHVNRRGNSFYRRGGESNPETRHIGSPALADLLNLGTSHTGKQFERSRPSLAVAGFRSLSGKTAGWEDDARNEFLIQLKRMLASGGK